MKEKDIQKFLLKGFKQDIEQKRKSYIYQLFMLTVRSMFPDHKGGNNLNIERFSKELFLWKGYRSGENKALNEFIFKKERNNYFDESALIRSIPIFISNQDMNKAIIETSKSSYLITNDLKTLILSIIIGILSIENIKGTNIEKVIKIIKEEIIGIETLQLVEILNIIKKERKKFIIEFEKIRIMSIGIIDKSFKLMEENKNFKEFFSNLKRLYLNKNITQEYFKIEDEIERFFTYIDFVEKKDLYIESISKYLYKLRKGRISPEKLLIKHSNNKSIYDMKKGEKLKNDLLGEILLRNIEVRGEFEFRYIEAKSGEYRFFRKIKAQR